MKVLSGLAILGTGLLLLSTSGKPVNGAGSAVAEDQPVVVHLSKFTNDLHAVSMALKLATGMQEKGASVTLFLDLEGVRLVDQRQNGDLSWGHGKPVGELFESFVAAGGKTLICPHCAHAAGVSSDHLRPGARLSEEGEMIEILLEAKKILDY